MTDAVKDIYKAFTIINKYGRSEISIDAYMRYICITRERISLLNRNLAIAELVSRLAPEGKKDEWYITGLLHDITDMAIPGAGYSKDIIVSVLKKAGISPTIIHTVTRRKTTLQNSIPLFAAINYASIHTDEEGNMLTMKECCAANDRNKDCNLCISSRFYLSERAGTKEPDKEIIKLREILEDEETRTAHERREVYGNKKQRALAKGSKEADAIHAG